MLSTSFFAHRIKLSRHQSSYPLRFFKYIHTDTSRASIRSNIYERDFAPYQVDHSINKKIDAVFTRIDDEEKSQFRFKQCLVTLSIGQPVHEKAHFAATLALVNRHFGSCTFILGDTLQRHTLAIVESSSPEKLLTETKKQGDNWLCDNIHLLSKLRIPWNVRRWDYWLEHKNFHGTLERVQRAYLKESSYREFFDKNIEKYLNRLKSRNELNIGEEQAFQHCLTYLHEECAAMCLWVEEKSHYELYANGRTPAMEATYLRFIETLHPDLLQPLSLRFKKRIVCENDFIEEPQHGADRNFTK